MIDLRLLLAQAVGKLTVFAIKTLGKTGGTAAPGLYALKIDPILVKKLSGKIKYGSIIVSGTNGKTTTARLIFDLLSKRFQIIHNRQGSNLPRGIASTLISASSLSGKISGNLGLWEVDEATLEEAVENTNPQMLVLLNLFRDQLDRYGEVDTIRQKWQKIIQRLPKTVTLVLNTDDPGISYLARFFKGKIIFFGVKDRQINLPKIASIADIRHCLVCQAPLYYQTLLSAHMGHYRCPNCRLKRPIPQVSAQNLKFKPDFSTSAKLTVNDQPFSVNYNLPGLYNVYNVLAAVAAYSNFQMNKTQLRKAIRKFAAAFGRFQKIKVKNKNVVIFLTKNPAGANEILRTIAIKDKISLLTALNDNFADGRDVSWIWDTNWEVIAPKTANITVSGIRASDQALRLKYAGFKLNKKNIHRQISYSIKNTLAQLSNNDTLIVLPTYTALLEVQKSLAKLAGISKWHLQ